MKFQIPKGLFDILPYEAKEPWQLSSLWQFVENEIHNIANDYGYQEIRTPIFEQTELFQRGVGLASDIVTKEMYTFEDKAGRSLTLRPEGTSSILRAFVEKNFDQAGSVHKLYYISPMFRHERPQAGRYRQHHQFGVEAIGVASYEQDVEVIDLLLEFYKRLGLQNLQLQINSIGDTKARSSYQEALVNYLKPQLKSLSKESQMRFEKNPFRILDSKDPTDQDILKEAPSILDFLDEKAKLHFDNLCSLLKKLNISFQINEKIVRGLDYYNYTVFEVICPDLGAQNSIGGGGRYDGFTQAFGGPALPGIGFGTGIERILQAMLKQKVNVTNQISPFVYIVPMEDAALELCFNLVVALRHARIPAEIDLKVKKIHKSLQRANELNANYSLIVGSEELSQKKANLKDMQTRQEGQINLQDAFKEIKELWEKNL